MKINLELHTQRNKLLKLLDFIAKNPFAIGRDTALFIKKDVHISLVVKESASLALLSQVPKVKIFHF